MVYLVIYILILVLFYILVNKIISNEHSHKEGFTHRGQGFVAEKSKKKELAEEEKPDSQSVIAVKTTYRIAADLAIIIIKMPYKFLSKGVDMLIRFVQNLNEMLKPMFAFVSQMGKIVQRIATQFYNIFKKIFKQGFSILSDLPGFIQKYVDVAIGFINKMVNKVVDMLTSFFDLFQNILNQLLEIPEKFFNIMDQMSTLFFNMFNMMLELPEKGLEMIIGLQGTLMGMMDRPLKVPFADQFLG